MMEYGQPMHAYDFDKIHGGKIIVKRASDGEIFTTLDGQERKLDSNVLMISDAERYVGIAGIMGGQDSMITDSVKTVLFEAATFNGTNIRKSSKRIGMRTDASAIFEKGLDPYNALAAMDRACQLMEELGCGTVAKTYVDVHEELPQLRRIPFEPEKINRSCAEFRLSRRRSMRTSELLIQESICWTSSARKSWSMTRRQMSWSFRLSGKI